MRLTWFACSRVAAVMGFATFVVGLLLLLQTPSLHGQPAPVAVTECTGTDQRDQDRDGLGDSCEVGIAHHFAPILATRSGGCNQDASVDPTRPGGGYFFAVQPVDGDVRIAYMPAWFRDCGWSGPKCILPGVDCSPHGGDSEIIVIELGHPANATGWIVNGVFLSAHCFGRTTGGCRWYRGNELQQFEWHGSAPVVWVAEGRNANYPSWQACDRGHHWIDTCDHHDTMVRFPITANRNVGSRAFPTLPGGCVDGRALASDAVDPDAVECFWTPDRAFRGWQKDGTGVTPYEAYLRLIAGF